ncbi:MAG: gliding motility lipoprotein GldD [Bacteroidales bacterium]
MRKITSSIIAIIAIVLVLAGCRENPVPRPMGYFRISFPEKKYRIYDTICPFRFEYPVYGNISYNTVDNPQPCWFNIDFPRFKARLHVSYKDLHGDITPVLKESFDYAYSHSVKADAITEQPWQNESEKVYGILYDIKGNTASSLQFFVTDSTTGFFRGALYFMAEPEKDSLAPVIDFFRKDIVHLIETFRWKNKK